jgi:hypothetical protein
MSQKDEGEIVNTEHIDVVDGENINALRTAIYGWDYTNNVWRRILVDTTGKLQ